MEISAVRSPAAREKPIFVMKKLFADMLYIYTLSSIIFREREREAVVQQYIGEAG